jgi:flagellar biosynthetic protein FlhB
VIADVDIRLDATFLQWFADQDKTEPATPKKKQDARKKGQVARSLEVPSALLTIGVFGLLAVYGSIIGQHMRDMFARGLRDVHREVTVHSVTEGFTALAMQSMWIVLPIFVCGMVLALASGFMQYGFLWTSETLSPKWEKINPIEGLKNIFSMRSIVELIKSVGKIVVIGTIATAILWDERDALLVLGRIPVWDTLSYLGHLTIRLGLIIGAVLCIFAIADYAYQRYEYEKNLRMSLQEVKDEYKKTEGDPLIKGKIRDKQRRMAMQRMMQEVPKADVVITNPTHYAVAIRYDAQTMAAPRVIAKGVDYIAMTIKNVAKKNDVLLVENKPLARALVEQVDINQAIPPKLFHAVAAVLAYVYAVRGKK